MKTKGTQQLQKGCFCLRLKAPGNNNQDLSLANHHGNVKTPVGEMLSCSAGGAAARVLQCLPFWSSTQEKAEAEQNLGKGSWV